MYTHLPLIIAAILREGSITHFTDTVLPQYYVTDFPQLQNLVLQSGQLNTIVPGAFVNASNLQQIDLRNNRLTWISGEMFEGVTSNLTRLQLNNNMISQLFSDLVSIFNLMPNMAGSQISLNGNNLNCSCQLQWLNDFIIFGNSRSINGATCTYSNGSSHVLGTVGLNFTECLDLCSLEYYSCPANTTCIPVQQNKTYECMAEQQITPSPSMLESPSMSVLSSSLFPLPSLSLSSLVSTELSSFLLISSTETSPSLSSYTSLLSSYGSTSSNSVHSSSLSLSSSSSSLSSSSSSLSSSTSTPSPTMTPVPLCSMEQCQVNQECMDFGCSCLKCQCVYPYVQTLNGTCSESSVAPLYCETDQAFGLMWPRVSYGSTVSLPCCSSVNSECKTANRTCQFSGQWSSVVGPKCVSPAIHSLSSYLMVNTSVDVAALSQGILAAVQSESLLPGDLPYLSDIILQIASYASTITSTETVQAIIESVSQLLSDSYYSTWQEVEMPSQSITKLFNAVEQLGFNLPLSNGSLNISTDNLVLVVLSPSGSEMGWNFSSNLLQNHTGGVSSIFLPGSILMDIFGDQNLSDCDVRLVVSMWDIDNRLLEVNSSNESSTPSPLVHGRCDWGSTGSSVSEVVMVNSIVITASVYSSNCSLNRTRFSEPVRITLHHTNTTLDNPSCSFLDPANDRGDGWIDDGCRVDTVHSGSNFTVCNCYHLTTFALLMSPTGAATVNQPLLIATKVGLCLSITALFITIILLFSLKIENELNQIHRQLALALCLSQLIFLVGVDRTSVPSPDILCTFIAGLLHYLLLCTFSWQLVEGVHLYLFIVRVFYNKKVVWLYYPLAWGIPLVIVGITMGVNFCDYGSMHYCWITNGNGALWAFHIPVIIVIIINFIVLLAVSVVVARASKRKDPNRCTLCSLLQASVILVPTLGLTWVLGFFVVGTDLYSTIVEWIFFVCTTMQGLTLFVIHCLISTEVRTAFLRAIGCHQAARKQKSVFELKPSAALSSIANSAEQWRRRVSLGGSRRGSMDPPASSFHPAPGPNNKEVNAYLIAKALYKLEEESVEDPSMFSQSATGTPRKNNNNKTSKVRFENEEDASSDTESCKDDMLMKGLLQAEDISRLTSIAALAGFKVEIETSETESVANAGASAISVEQSSSEVTLKTPLLQAQSTKGPANGDLLSINKEESIDIETLCKSDEDDDKNQETSTDEKIADDEASEDKQDETVDETVNKICDETVDETNVLQEEEESKDHERNSNCPSEEFELISIPDPNELVLNEPHNNEEVLVHVNVDTSGATVITNANFNNELPNE
uniref:G-protein coupled receptors family 2 profile 2 domain-containing protein n=1 Tax=Amphimedon queenslandica TaxID=400682 RepID=A0A1X7VA05_AMPQE